MCGVFVFGVLRFQFSSMALLALRFLQGARYKPRVTPPKVANKYNRVVLWRVSPVIPYVLCKFTSVYIYISGISLRISSREVSASLKDTWTGHANRDLWFTEQNLTGFNKTSWQRPGSTIILLLLQLKWFRATVCAAILTHLILIFIFSAKGRNVTQWVFILKLNPVFCTWTGHSIITLTEACIAVYC